MYRLITVPLDRSTFGEHALPVAATVARAAGAALRLVHVQEPLAPATEIHAAGALLVESDERSTRESRRYLDDLAGRVAKIAGTRASAVLLDGEVGGGVAESLASDAGGSGSDLIVMSTHGRGGIGRLLLGSVAESVVRHASVPVLLVRAAAGKPDLGRPWSCAHILLPLDGSEFAEQVVGHAEALATLLGAACTLLTIVEPLPLTMPAADIGGAVPGIVTPVVPHLLEQNAAEAMGHLEKVAERLRQRGIEVRTETLSHPEPARAITGFAARNAVDLIALCTHARHGLDRLLLGSVAEQVLRNARTAVLTLRPASGE